MVNSEIYLEGGGDSKEQHSRCRKGFRELFEKCKFNGRMPRFFACGGRTQVFEAFKTAIQNEDAEFIAMLIDSENPLEDIDNTWAHLKKRDNWDRPQSVADEQVLFMSTCMETWIVADRDALREHYGQHLQESALPEVDTMLENRDRHDIQDRLERATRNCANYYKKGNRSFIILGKLCPQTLKQHLPSFTRTLGILRQKL